MKSGASESTQHVSHSLENLVRVSLQISSLSATRFVETWGSRLFSTHKQCLTLNPCAIHVCNAWSTIVLRCRHLFPRITALQVSTTVAWLSRMRWESDSAEKPAKTTEWTAPIRAHANIEIGNSRSMGRYITTRSPCWIPILLSQFANLFTSFCSSL